MLGHATTKVELGDDTTTNHLTPAQVSALGTTVTGVSASGRHACARVTGGGLRCWGWNAAGELGDGTLIDRSLPVTVTGFGSAIAEVSAGINHNTCARTVTGTVSCAGSNTSGQVGDGTTTNRSTPVPVLSEVATVPAVDHKTLGLLALLLVALAVATLRRSAAVALLVAGFAVSLTACDGAQDPAGSAAAPPPPEEVGSISFDLTLGSNIQLNTVDYVVAGPNNFMKAGSLDVSHAATVSGIIGGLPAGVGYALTLTATDVAHKLTGCQGAATFNVAAAATTAVPIHMTCREAPTAPGVPLSPVAMLALAIVLAGTGCAALRRHRMP